MILEIKVPSPGESITEVQISKWLKADGDMVEKDEDICEIDSDKATLTLSAEESGEIKIIVKEGEIVKVNSVICTIETDKKSSAGISGRGSIASADKNKIKSTEKEQIVIHGSEKKSYSDKFPSVSAKKIIDENDLKISEIKASGKGGRITKADVLSALQQKSDTPSSFDSRGVRKEKMTMLRKKISERLVAVKNQTAMLTTFNEVDMSKIIEIRKKYKEEFLEKHGVGLGFMSFFTKAVTGALQMFPEVNAMIDGNEIVYHDYADIGIAVSTPRGLMVPVIRNADGMTFAMIEKTISELAEKAREGTISIDEMTGGTFTISNGGVFGSLLSTPILNPPQSAILGMHNIVDRPVAIDGKVEIRPMMYVALSYDHRIIDGKESVSFLVKIKEELENPVILLTGSDDPVKQLLDL